MATSSDRISPPGTVFDCPVFVQAFLNAQGTAFACLELAEAGVIDLHTSSDTLTEVFEVISRPAIRRGRKQYSHRYIGAFRKRLLACSKNVEEVPSVNSYPRDPKDEP